MTGIAPAADRWLLIDEAALDGRADVDDVAATLVAVPLAAPLCVFIVEAASTGGELGRDIVSGVEVLVAESSPCRTVDDDG